MTTRKEALESIQKFLPQIGKLYEIKASDLQLYPDYEGCQNILYFYTKYSVDYVLRISFRKDRPPEQIHAELDFILFLHKHGVRVSPPVRSQEGRYAEMLRVDDIPFIMVSFVKAPGHRVPDMGYKYRERAPIEEYFRNWGAILGKMHRVTRQYSPENLSVRRPHLIDKLANHYIPNYLPPSYSKVKERFLHLLERVDELPKDKGAYGLIHSDFNDGNFCVDYTNGNITAFDFDDSSYCWFMYDLATAWQGGTGRTMHQADPGQRRDFMDKYFDTLLNGYTREHTLPEKWLKLLPTFLKVAEMEGFLDGLRYMSVNGADGEYDGAMAYQQKCIEDDIPFLGFFDSIYSQKHPFQLNRKEWSGKRKDFLSKKGNDKVHP